jgi:hypothetical protein
MDYADTSKLWSLALEFTEKLDKNREMLANLRKQAEELKVGLSDRYVSGFKTSNGVGECKGNRIVLQGQTLQY